MEDRVDGISEIHAVTGTPDAHAFDIALNQVADGSVPAQQPRKTSGTVGPTIHINLHTDAVEGLAGGVGAKGTGHVARALASVEQWLADLAPGARVTVTPVVDLTEQISVDPDEGGPPGQTSTHNLAKLCRFRHRVKTHAEWNYEREPDGSLTWTSPLGRSYTMDQHDTRATDA